MQLHSSIKPNNCRLALMPTLLLLLLLRAIPAAAQNTSSPSSTRATADSLRQIAREDTTYALQRLFHENRRRYAMQAIMRGAGLGYVAYRTLTTLQTSDKAEVKIVNVALTSALGYLFTRSVIGLYRYRSSRERKLLAAFEQGRPIPAKVRKRFKSSYFDTATTSN